MKTFRTYLRENLTNIGSLVHAVSATLGDVGRLSFSNQPADAVSSDVHGEMQSLHYIVRKNPSKSFRVLLHQGQPVAVQVWSNFGWTNGHMRPPDSTINIADEAHSVDDLAATIINDLSGDSDEINENYSDLSTDERKRWRDLRAVIRRQGGSRIHKISTYWPRAKQLGVPRDTFSDWVGKRAPRVRFQPVGKVNKKSRTGDLGYISSVHTQREQGVADSKIVDNIDRAAQTYTKAMLRGSGASLIIAGRGGTGKTFLVKSVLGGQNRGHSWQYLKGNQTPRQLYSFLFKHRKGQILVFDDVNVWKDLSMINMFKGALETDPEDRLITWDSKDTISKPRGVSDEEFLKGKEAELYDAIDNGAESKWKPPKTFKFASQIIFITNKPMKDIVEDEHLGAVADRSAKVDYDFDDGLMLEKLARTWKHQRQDIPEEDRKKMFDLIKKSHDQRLIHGAGPRMFDNICGLFKAGVDLKEIKDMMHAGNV